MIADYPFLANLAAGVDRVIPQEGDNQVVIPGTVVPVVFPLFAHDMSNSVTDVANTSKLIQSNFIRLNQVAITSDVLILPKGLYDLQLNFAGRSNFTTTVLTEFSAVILFYQGFSPALATLYMNTESGSVNVDRQLLLTSQATLRVSIPATNAVGTNSIALTLCGSVIRRI